MNSSIAKGGTDVDTRVRTQMIQNIAQKNVGHARNRAPIFSAIISAARVPVVRSIYVDLSSDVAVSHPAAGHDGDWVQIMVDTVEVPVHLDKKQKVASGQSDWSLGKYRVLALELNQLAHAGFPTLGVPKVIPLTETELGRFSRR